MHGIEVPQKSSGVSRRHDQGRMRVSLAVLQRSEGLSGWQRRGQHILLSGRIIGQQPTSRVGQDAKCKVAAVIHHHDYGRAFFYRH